MSLNFSLSGAGNDCGRTNNNHSLSFGLENNTNNNCGCVDNNQTLFFGLENNSQKCYNPCLHSINLVTGGNTGYAHWNNTTNTWTFTELTSSYITSISDTSTIDLDVTSGVLTANFASLNISQFTNNSGYLTSSTGVVSSRTLTINGSAQDLSADRTWTITTTGTTNRITVSGGNGLTPTIDIAATYIGQTSITTLGTIIAGTWNATKISEVYGGTNQDSYTTGDMLYASASNSLSKLSIGTSGQVLVSNGSSPSWSSTIGGATLTEIGYLSGATSNIQNQINNISSGLSWKNSARVATTANITLSGTQTIDGVAVIAGDRVLVKNQATQTENGIYLCAAGSWTRTTDADTGAEILQATISIEEGTVNADTIYTCTTNAPITIGVSNIVFAKTSATTYTASNGITLTSNNFTFDYTYFTGDVTFSSLGVTTIGASKVTNSMLAGSITASKLVGTDITTVGTVTSGTWASTVSNAATVTLKDSLFTLQDDGDTSKQLQFQLSGSTTGKTTTIATANALNATYTLPSATSTLLANNLGISGGSTLVGGTAASETLTFSTTSHATKGKIIFGTSAYDEANNWLGIGTTSPAYRFDLTRTFVSGTTNTYRGANFLLTATTGGAVSSYAGYFSNQVQGVASDGRYGVYAEATSAAASTGNGTSYGIYGKTLAGNTGYGVYGEANGNGSASRTWVGVRGVATNYSGTSTNAYGGWFSIDAQTTTTIGRGIYVNLAYSSTKNTTNDYYIDAANNGTSVWSVRGTGLMSVGTSTAPTGWLTLAATTTTIPAIVMLSSSGTTLTTAIDGALEYDGTNYFASVSTTRYTIMKALCASATLNFGSTAAQSSSDLTITVTGAALNDEVLLGVPNGSADANTCYTAWVSASNTVTVRFNNYSSGSVDPASGTFKVSVIKR